jgi:hypothetical protein
MSHALVEIGRQGCSRPWPRKSGTGPQNSPCRPTTAPAAARLPSGPGDRPDHQVNRRAARNIFILCMYLAWALVGAGGGHNLVGLVSGAVWAWGQTRPSSEQTSCKQHFHLVQVYHIRRMSLIIIVALSEADAVLFEENQMAQRSRWCMPPAGSKHMPPTIFTTRAGSASAGLGKHFIGRWPEEQYRPAGECHCGGAGRDSAGGRASVGHCRASLGSNKCSGPMHLISGACH